MLRVFSISFYSQSENHLGKLPYLLSLHLRPTWKNRWPFCWAELQNRRGNPAVLEGSPWRCATINWLNFVQQYGRECWNVVSKFTLSLGVMFRSFLQITNTPWALVFFSTPNFQWILRWWLMLQRHFYHEHAANSIYLQPKTSSESNPFVAGSNPHERYNLFFGYGDFPVVPALSGFECSVWGFNLHWSLKLWSWRRHEVSMGENHRVFQWEAISRWPVKAQQLRFVVPKQWRFSSNSSGM